MYTREISCERMATIPLKKKKKLIDLFTLLTLLIPTFVKPESSQSY